VGGVRGATLLVRFLCELGMLAGLAYWGFRAGDGPVAVALGIGAPLLAAVAWGVFVAPKAPWRMPPPSRVMIEFFLFGFSALALADAGQAALAIALGVGGVGTALLNASQEQAATV
jgi:hypothetical protein